MNETAISFDHVHLISQDPRSAGAWYAEKLGGNILGSFEIRGAPQVVVAFEGATLLIRGRRGDEQVKGKDGLRWGTDHFGFKVGGDFDGYCEDLREKGVRFTLDPVDFTPQVRIAFIAGPDGVEIELLQRKP